MAEVSKNHALSTKAKMEALEKMVDVIGKYGEIETMLKMNDIESFQYQDIASEDSEKNRAHKDATSNEFVSKIMNGMGPSMGDQNQQMGSQGQPQQMGGQFQGQ